MDTKGLGGFSDDARRFEDIDRAQPVAECVTCTAAQRETILLPARAATIHLYLGHYVREIPAKEKP